METMQNSIPALSLLVVDDDKMARDVLRLMIEREFPNSSIYFAENGRIGVERFKEHTPDIVITDISMPVMDGMQMVGEIKSINYDTKIIVLTGYSEMDYSIKISEFGIKECILKPIVFKRLFAAIENCIDEITLERK
jgi:YesN/AraC family two-component response regulator